MKSNWVDFKAVKTAVPITAILDRYHISGLKKQGAELRGRCPIHKGEGDSFHVNISKNAFHCFSCQAKGNALDLVAALEQCSVRDAALKLQEWFDLAAGATTEASRPTPRPEPSGARQDGGKAPADSKLAAEGTAGERGSEDNTPLRFQLKGIDHTHPYLKQRGVTEETAIEFGVGYFAGKGSMAGRVVIPIHNGAGELVAYAGRAIDQSEPRYKLPAGFHKSAELYNLHRAIGAGERGLIIVEGYFDAMKVHQAGYPFVVALMGCSMSEQQERLLVEHADQVLIMLDGDGAGRQGTDELLARLGRGIWTKAITMPEGKQPDQLAAEELQQLLEK